MKPTKKINLKKVNGECVKITFLIYKKRIHKFKKNNEPSSDEILSLSNVQNSSKY